MFFSWLVLIWITVLSYVSEFLFQWMETFHWYHGSGMLMGSHSVLHLRIIRTFLFLTSGMALFGWLILFYSIEFLLICLTWCDYFLPLYLSIHTLGHRHYFFFSTWDGSKLEYFPMRKKLELTIRIFGDFLGYHILHHKAYKTFKFLWTVEVKFVL